MPNPHVLTVEVGAEVLKGCVLNPLIPPCREKPAAGRVGAPCGPHSAPGRGLT
jgi:hypothetical protein